MINDMKRVPLEMKQDSLKAPWGFGQWLFENHLQRLVVSVNSDRLAIQSQVPFATRCANGKCFLFNLCPLNLIRFELKTHVNHWLKPARYVLLQQSSTQSIVRNINLQCYRLPIIKEHET